MFPLNISRCLDANGAIVPLGNTEPRHAQKLSKEPEWAANTAYQWHLLVNIQRTIAKEQLTLKRFLKLRYTPQLAYALDLPIICSILVKGNDGSRDDIIWWALFLGVAKTANNVIFQTCRLHSEH